MALRTSTMNMPFSDRPLELEPEKYHLLRKVTIVLLLAIASSLWLYILFHEKKLPYPTPVQEIASGIVIAIVAGLGAQLILSQRDGFIRFVVSMAADVAGVYLLGFVSHGKYGISKFGWLPKSIDYDGLNLIGLGFLVLLFISLVFRRTRVIVIPEPIQVIPAGTDSNSFSSVQMEPSSSIPISNGQRPQILGSRLFTPDSSLQRSPSNGRRSGLIQPFKSPPVIAPKRRRRNKKARVQLALVGEHRCPFCLDTVSRTDPRGVKECNVCHTLHHKDCWDITGSCQVPHLNQ